MVSGQKTGMGDGKIPGKMELFSSKRDALKPGRRFKFFFWGLFVIMVISLFSGCKDTSSQSDEHKGGVERVNYDNFSIPIFETASEQLNYARSLFFSPNEKSAALKVLIDRFPEDREKRGEARLELAYMNLGNDFRLADRAACERTLRAYESIAGEYADIPAVFTKAYWYMGWIHADLLNDKSRGVALYSVLAENYPENSFSRISPVPWLDLIFPSPRKKPYTADDRYIYSWAGLALLEIVRNTDDPTKKMEAFEKLWKEHRNSLATGYALKEILGQSDEPEKMKQVIKTYIALNTVNPELNKDLERYLFRGAKPAVNKTRP